MTIYINCMKYHAPTPGFDHDVEEGNEEEACRNLFSTKRSQRQSCPFSVIFKKQELIPGNTENKHVHPNCHDDLES